MRTLLLVLFFVFAGEARADLYSHYVYSLEYLTDGCPLIIEATVRGEWQKNEMKSEIVAVNRSLKGKVPKPLVIPKLGKSVPVAREIPVLLFLRPGAKANEFRVSFAIFLKEHELPKGLADKDRPGYFGPRILSTTSAGEDPVFSYPAECVAITKTGKVLTRPADVLALVEARAKAFPQRAEYEGFHARHEAELEMKDVCFHLFVPFDPEYRAIFVKEMASEITGTRANAAYYLRHYRDDVTEKLLRRALTDDATSKEPANPPQAMPEVTVYPVRRAAWKSLKSWGLNVPQPVLVVP